MLGENQSALADANAAIRYSKNFAVAYQYRGWIRVRLAEYRAAFVDYNRALRIDPRYAAAATARSRLATWIVAAQNAGVRAYGIASIDVAAAERAAEVTPSEYQVRAGQCGGYFSEGDSYYDDCINKGVEEAKNDESADHEADQQAAEVGYNVEQQVQEDINYQVAATEEAQAAAAESSNEGYGGGGESEGADESSSEPQSESESEPEPEAPAAEPESGGE
jgi:tetratricopeptide (TPR) repeat protein